MSKQIYKAANVQDASIMRDILRQESIPVEIRNENLSGALGELPAFEISPTLWVSEEFYERAKKLVEEVEAQRLENANLPTWKCANCGEENEGSFLECWSCGSEKD